MRRNYLQWHIFERDSFTCVLCNAPASELHHVVPRGRGGNNYPDNLVSVCRPHHMTLHGQRVAGVEFTPAEARQYVFEYICDAYAHDDSYRRILAAQIESG